MEEQVKLIRKRLAEANDRQKSYADAKRTPRQFVMGEKVLLRVKPNKSSIKFGKSSKLASRYVGPFEVLEVVNPVDYRIALLPALERLHNVFHVSYFKKYVSDFAHMIDWNSLQVQDPGVVMIKPIRVLEVRKQRLRNKEVTQCKVQWDQYTEDSATWEDYNEIHHRFPHLFNVFNS
ncbi:uncharacterized protein LOC131874381 [Cryptomeria japonica]|uniref:uncharacterized protein LOC131874381 n=1 Tax=Cryptomeria japonica TaxID=3369 RepID=UPI0027DAA6E1|nr:uncharacterized protein LOC131874381 [Cryptomeria japonica]